MELRKELMAGIAGGLAGGTVMTLVMTMGRKTGMIEKPLPLKIEQELEERAGVEHKTSTTQENLIAFSGHYAISVFFGALYGLLRWATGLSPMPSGPLYGLSTYVLNLVGLGPALQLTPPPWDEKPVTVGRRVMMHAVFGTVTALVSGKVRQMLSGQNNRILMNRASEFS